MADRLDPFTERRLARFVEDFRNRSGQLPTGQDLERGGFARELIETAVREKVLEMFYVTLTSGSIVKTYKVASRGGPV